MTVEVTFRFLASHPDYPDKEPGVAWPHTAEFRSVEVLESGLLRCKRGEQVFEYPPYAVVRIKRG